MHIQENSDSQVLGQNAVLSNQIAGFFGYQCFWKELINIVSNSCFGVVTTERYYYWFDMVRHTRPRLNLPCLAKTCLYLLHFVDLRQILCFKTGAGYIFSKWIHKYLSYRSICSCPIGLQVSLIIKTFRRN